LKIYRENKIQTDRYLSSDFNIFKYVDIRENPLSKYIAMILDYEGEHGQQDLFQKLFIKFLKTRDINVPNLKYKIQVEYPANGRIDIFLSSEDVGIIIENKPYTVDQYKQLERYFNNISGSYRNVIMLYLSNGTEPSEDSISKEMRFDLIRENKFRTISYQEFAVNFISECYKHCESQKFRFFLKDFRSFLIYTFPEEGTIQGDTND
jgi:hypothetical protein